MNVVSSIDASPGELLELARRRENLSIRQTARLLGASPKRYRDWELGRRSDVPVVDVEPEPFEYCYLLRKRKGWTLSDVEERSGLKGHWIHRAERGETDAAALILWWRLGAQRTKSVVVYPEVG